MPSNAKPKTRFRRSRIVTFATLAVALLAGACKDDDGAAGEEVASEEVASEEVASQDLAEASVTDEGRTDEATRLAAADGWSELLDLDIPGPGKGVFEFDGSRFELEVSCQFPGEVPDGFRLGSQPMNEAVLFSVLLTGRGQSEEGRRVRVSLGREIHIRGDVFDRLRHRGWGGDGQWDRITVQGLGRTSAILKSPSSDDPDGELLPVIRVSPNGEVTAQGDLAREFADQSDVPEGPFTFAGRCQDTWPEEVLESN